MFGGLTNLSIRTGCNLGNCIYPLDKHLDHSSVTNDPLLKANKHISIIVIRKFFETKVSMHHTDYQDRHN